MIFDELEQIIANYPQAAVKDERFITAHYYVEATYDIAKAAAKVASHQSTAASVWSEQTLLDRCSAKVSQVQYLDSNTKGLVAISFPVEMFGQPVYSGDILHIVSGAVQHDESEHRMFYLRDLELPESIVSQFPGPRYGAALLDSIAKPVIGTIIKPCTGIDLDDYQRIVSKLVSFDELKFIKEDENLFPHFIHCPLSARVKIAAKVIKQSGRQLIFAPHVSSNPRDFFKNLELVAQAGLPAVMFSETYYGGLFRAARDYIKEKGLNLAIYAHNGGICVKTSHINRLVLDRLARLDGADWRQTAPTGETCYLRPLAWQRDADEDVLTNNQDKKKATICVRAGGLDQGNLLQNLYECADELSNYMFLMGSAINSIKNAAGQYDPAIGIRAIRSLLELYERRVKVGSVAELYKLARAEGMGDLATCLSQRYDRIKLPAVSS